MEAGALAKIHSESLLNTDMLLIQFISCFSLD
jgi:hypothetical protein